MYKNFIDNIYHVNQILQLETRSRNLSELMYVFYFLKRILVRGTISGTTITQLNIRLVNSRHEPLSIHQ